MFLSLLTFFSSLPFYILKLIDSLTLVDQPFHFVSQMDTGDIVEPETKLNERLQEARGGRPMRVKGTTEQAKLLHKIETFREQVYVMLYKEK